MNKNDKKIPLQKGLKFKGVWNVQLFNAKTGEKELDHTQDNIIVDLGVATMCSGVGPAHFSTLHLGTTPVSALVPPATSDTELQTDIATAVWATTHTHLLPPDVPFGTFSFAKKATLAITDAVGTLTEAGLFSSGAKPAMFNHILFNPPIIKTDLQTAYITTTITILRV